MEYRDQIHAAACIQDMDREEGAHGQAAIAPGDDGPGEDEHQRHPQVEEPGRTRQPLHPVVEAIYPTRGVRAHNAGVLSNSTLGSDNGHVRIACYVSRIPDSAIW